MRASLEHMLKRKMYLHPDHDVQGLTNIRRRHECKENANRKDEQTVIAVSTSLSCVCLPSRKRARVLRGCRVSSRQPQYA